MQKMLFAVTIAIALGLTSCYDNPQDPTPTPGQQGTFKITGYVSLNNQPLEGVEVVVDDALNWRSQTTADGKFVVEGLTKGEHKFFVKKSYDNNRSISQQIAIILVNDVTDLGEIKLPFPLFLYNVDGSNDSEAQLTLRWSRSLNSDFVEYKVFRKNNDGLDDTNSDLIFSSSSVADTQFTDINVPTGVRQYYRVFAYSGDQKSSGSNFQLYDVPEVNLISNAGFEITADGTFPDQWRQSISGIPTFKYFTLDHDNVHWGFNSLKVYYNDAESYPVDGHLAWGGLMQTIPKNFLVPGREYTLSFWAKSVNGSFQVRLIRNSNLEDAIISYIIPDKTDWTEQKFSFKMDDANYYELWISTRPGFMINGTVTGYVDDIKILR